MAKTRIMIKLSNGKYIDMSKAKTIKPEDKVHTVMREFKEGKLKSSSGQIVTSRDQAIAIAMSESGMSKNMIHDIAVEYDTMEKARPTKYIKRVPKPSGKGYYYFYTREQVKDFQEKGIVPKEEKGGNFWDKVKSFFGNNAEEKVNKLHEIVSGTGISVTKDSLAEHLAEYLNNKDKWDAKFRGEKKEKGETKPKTESAKSEKKESGAKKEGSKWNNNLMKFFSNQYGMIGALKKEEVKKEYQGSQKSLKGKPLAKEEIESYLYTEKEQNKLKGILENEDVDSDAYKKAEKRFDLLEKEMNDQVEAAIKSYGITADEFVAQVNKYTESKSESKDNFETMPEGEKKSGADLIRAAIKITDSGSGKTGNLDWTLDKEKGIIEAFHSVTGSPWGQVDLNNGNIVPHKTGRENDLKKIYDEISIFAGSNEDRQKVENLMNYPIKNKDEINKIALKNKGKDWADKIISKFESESDNKPSATEALKEIERTERFPEVPTYAEPPEGFKKVEGTTAPKGYEFYRNGSPLSKDYKQVLVKDKSKVEALKDELGKKDKEKEGESEKGKGFEIVKGKKEFIDALGKKRQGNKIIIKGLDEYDFIISSPKDAGSHFWGIFETSTGKRVEQGSTKENAIKAVNTIIKKHGKKKFDELIKQSLEKQKKEKDVKEQITKDFEDKTPKGQASIKKMEDEEKKKKEHEANLQSKDPQVKYDAMKKEIDSLNDKIKDFNDFENFNVEFKNNNFIIDDKEISSDALSDIIKFGKENDINDLKTDAQYKKWDKIKEKLKDNETVNVAYSFAEHIHDTQGKDFLSAEEINKYAKNQKELSKIKEELLGPKMFKALSNLRQEIMFKAQPTKYIKRISNPNGKGYIYFYTQAQVKEYEKTGKIPDDQKKKPEVKESTGKGNIEILKESIKKVASIFADALSAKDAVQPTGQGVEQTGENIAQKSKDKKRLEKQRDIRKTTKKNTPEEKPTK